ncbi:hypothetical protein, partial [Burkholderia multivorans]|uniref:hypothetical protein n=1 Tax=Burkholderia multivorans TaxID=87883 RepID=UPI001C614093
NSYVNLKIATCLVRYADDRLIDQRFPRENTDCRFDDRAKARPFTEFFLCDGDLSRWRAETGPPAARHATCTGLEKFIFFRHCGAPILHSIRGTMFLIWNT